MLKVVNEFVGLAWLGRVALTAIPQRPAGGPPRPRIADFSGLRKILLELLFAAAINNVLALALPVTMLQIYDRIIPHQSASTFGLLVGGVVIALVLSLLIQTGQNYLTGWLGATIDHKLSLNAFRRLLDISIADYEHESAAVHLERMRTTASVRDFYSGRAILSLFDLPFAVLYILVITLLGGWLVLVPLAVLAAFALFAYRNVVSLHEYARDQVKSEERRFSFLTETLSGIHSVKALAMENMMLRRYEMLQDNNAHHSFEGAGRSINVLNLNALFSQVAMVALVAVGAGLVVQGQLTPGALAACITLTTRALRPLQSAFGVWSTFQKMAVARQQLEHLFEMKPAGNVEAPPLPAIEGGLRLEHVSYRFGAHGDWLFSDLDLSIEPGECITIEGESGSGKSSLLSLMAGMIEPTSGRVLADDFDLAQYGPSSVSREIAYLPQQGLLFDGTILDNLTMFRPELEPAALEVAREMGLDRVVSAMRNGYNTMIGNSAGDSVPGGVRQRIAIARALIHNPRILLFDEANNALDTAGDDLLRRYLEKLKGQRTLVLVTHRPSLTKLADRVFTLAAGKLTEGRAPAPPPPAAAVVSPADALAYRPRPGDSGDYGAVLATRFSEQSDLSLCLPRLLAALNWRGTSRQFAEALPHMADILDLDGFRRVMADLNFRGQFFKARLNEIDPRILPCVFLPTDSDALVLLDYNEDHGFLAYDGGSRHERYIRPSEQRGEVHVFRPSEPAPRGAAAQGWVRRMVDRFKPMIALGLVLTIVINVLSLSSPMFTMLVYDTVIPSGDLRLIPWLVIGLAVLLTVDWNLRRLRAQILAYMAARSEFVVGTAIFQRVLALPANATEAVPVGSQISRIKDFESLREMFAGPLALLFYELPGTLVFVVALGIIFPWLLVALIIAMGCYAALIATARSFVATRTEQSSRARSRMQEFLSDALSKMRGIKFAGVEDVWYERFRQLSGKAVAAELRSQIFAALMSRGAAMLGNLTGLAILSVCVIGTFTGAVSTGTVVGAMMIVWRLLGPLQSGILSLATLSRVTRSVRQIDNLMRLGVERDPNAPRQQPASLRGEVGFVRASFRYSNEADPVLLGVNFTIEPGQVCGIAGPNGAGKSTMLKLMTGLYLPQAGSVRLDNVDIRQIDPAQLRTLVSYAPQRCDLFYGTIAQNLRLAYPTASDDELRWAAEMAGILADIQAMPDGFNSRLADGSSEQLPHGFRQRLSLARAYLKPAPVMLFDEPGNGLDAEGDRAFTEAVGRLKRNRTVIFVSHRPSHLRMADQVVFMEDGYVRKIGSWDQVSTLVLGGP